MLPVTTIGHGCEGVLYAPHAWACSIRGMLLAFFRDAHGNGTDDRASFYSTHDALESPHSSRSSVTPPLTRVL